VENEVSMSIVRLNPPDRSFQQQQLVYILSPICYVLAYLTQQCKKNSILQMINVLDRFTFVAELPSLLFKPE